MRDSNIIEAKCRVCNRKFFRYKKLKGVRKRAGHNFPVRRSNSFTCSHKCSEIYQYNAVLKAKRLKNGQP